MGQALATDGVGSLHYLAGAQAVAFADTNVAVAAPNNSAFTLLGFLPEPTALLCQGWFGVGTRNPQAPLHVVGNVVVEQANRFDIGANAVQLGQGTVASGYFGSTAIGSWTTASGNSATAMGEGTRASGYGATAMGQGSTAMGHVSTAMGEAATASGRASMAMGSHSLALGDFSTALGFSTTASNNYSTAMGPTTMASGIGSTAMGVGTRASALNSTAMGAGTLASGAGSTAMGSNTTASGYASVAMGWSTVASGDYSFTMGNNSQATGSRAFAIGTLSLARGDQSVAMGKLAAATNASAVALGDSTLAGGPQSFAMGTNSVALGIASVALGMGSLASGDYSTALGGGVAENSYSFAVDGDAIGSGSVALGGGRAEGSRSFAVGLSAAALNLRSTAIGYTASASGDYAMALGYSVEATGLGSIGLGYNTTASGDYSTALGRDTTASGDYSTAMGRNTKATNTYSAAAGYYSEANGDSSFAGGTRARANHRGSFVWADYTNNSSYFTSSSSNQFLIRARGGVGINKTDPDVALDIVGGARLNDRDVYLRGTGDLNHGLGWYGDIKLFAGVNVDGPVLYGNSGGGLGTTGGSANLVLNWNSSGRVGLGRQPSANTLEVEGNASKSTAGSWLANSDARIKRDIEPVTGALEKLDKVRLVNFHYTDEYRRAHPSVADRQYVNVVAQEFREVFPEEVRSSGERLADGSEILQVDTYPLTIYSAAAVQELHQQLKAKDAEIRGLKARLEAIERRLDNIPAK